VNLKLGIVRDHPSGHYLIASEFYSLLRRQLFGKNLNIKKNLNLNIKKCKYYRVTLWGEKKRGELTLLASLLANFPIYP
jgi:hypothetical protein